jgi:hypothetical protein
MNEQHAQVAIAAAGMLAGDQARPGAEFPSARNVLMNISKREERGSKSEEGAPKSSWQRR